MARMKTLLVFLVVGAGHVRNAAFVPEDGSFSARFPGPPIHDVLTVPTPEGPQTRHVFRYSDDEIIYFVWHACTPPPSLPADPEKALDLARQEARTTSGSASISERRIRVNGRPGREFVDEVLGHKGFGRTVLGHNGAFYSVTAGTRSKAAEGKALAFLRSFSVLPPSPRALCRPK